MACVTLNANDVTEKSPFPALLLHILLEQTHARAVTSAKLDATYQSIPLLKYYILLNYYIPNPTVILSICCWALQAHPIHLTCIFAREKYTFNHPTK